ncbi:MAG TPA: PDZ domain-containing protein [Gemmatimonadales bacterium]|nr:PDZ domain-containing protein [Gemmatimonadales bacterium]
MNRTLLSLGITLALPALAAAQRPRAVAPRSGGMVYTLSGSHARIGVVVATGADADSDKIGARLSAITPGGPAEKAGLRAGDVVTKFNGVSLANVRSEDSDESGPGNKLVELAQALDPGDTVQLEYRRGADTKKATLVAEDVTYSLNGTMPSTGFSFAMPPMPRVETAPFGDLAPSIVQDWGSGNGMGFCFGDSWCNLELVSLNSDLGDYFGTHDGLLVVKATEDSTLPLKSGDVILSIGDRKPTSPAHAMRILRSYDVGESVQIEIMRHQKRQTVTWKVPNPEERDRVRMKAPRARSEEGAYRSQADRVRLLERRTRERVI